MNNAIDRAAASWRGGRRLRNAGRALPLLDTLFGVTRPRSALLIAVVVIPLACGRQDDARAPLAEGPQLTGTPSELAAAVPKIEMAARAHINVPSSPVAEIRSERLLLSTLYGDSVRLGLVEAMLEVGDTLIIVDGRTDPHLLAYDLRSGALLATHARHGRGPGEVTAPVGVQRDERDAQLVWVYDFEQRRLVGIDISARAAPPQVRAIGGAGTLLNPMIRDGAVISNGLFTDFSLVFLDSAGVPSGRSDLRVPFAPPEVTNNTALRLLNVSIMAFAPTTRSRVVLAYQFKPELDILDLESGEHFSVQGPISTTTSFRIDPESRRFFWNEDNQMAYSSVAADDSTIYALLSGVRIDEVAVDSLAARRVHVFDWSGQFLGELILDRESRKISVSADGQQLYASVESPWPAVGSYVLPRASIAAWKARVAGDSVRFR